MNTKGTILLVENNPSDLLSYTDRLKIEGYEVLTASNPLEANRILATERVHLVLSDIRLINDSNKNDISGIDLCRGLDPDIPRILVTGFDKDLEADLVASALRKPRGGRPIADDFIFKREIGSKGWNGPLRSINEVFIGKVRINFDLQMLVDGQTSAKPLASELLSRSRSLRASGIDLEVEIAELFQKLFYEETKINIALMSAGGYSESAVVRVHGAKKDTGLEAPVVVKLGLRPNINAEEENYRKYVEPKAGFRSTRLERAAYTKNLGGIVYTLIGSSTRSIKNFKSFYEESTLSKIVEVVNNLFEQNCEHWYNDRGNREVLDLVEIYQKQYNFDFEKLETKWLKDQTPQFFKQSTMKFTGIKGDFINPVYYLIGRKSYPVESYQCITHGDLNSGNILVDTHLQTWLIDFYSTGPGFILRDFIELETEIRLNLSDTTDIKSLFRFEISLLQSCSFDNINESRSLAYRQKELKKAFKIIQTIRQHAASVLSPDRNMEAYYVGLLIHTLCLLRFYKISKPRRHHIILSASLICARLSNGAALRHSIHS